MSTERRMVSGRWWVYRTRAGWWTAVAYSGINYGPIFGKWADAFDFAASNGGEK